MGKYVASQVVKLMIKKGITVNGATLIMLGITFKENCPDVRNTKIVDVVNTLIEYGIEVTIYDPIANPDEVKHEYNINTTSTLPDDKFDAVVLGVAHKIFLKMDLSILQKDKSILYDVKSIINQKVDGAL